MILNPMSRVKEMLKLPEYLRQIVLTIKILIYTNTALFKFVSHSPLSDSVVAPMSEGSVALIYAANSEDLYFADSLYVSPYNHGPSPGTKLLVGGA